MPSIATGPGDTPASFVAAQTDIANASIIEALRRKERAMKREEIDETRVRLAKAESDSRTWQLDDDVERYIEAYDRAEELEAQLEDQLDPTVLATPHITNAGSPSMLSNLSTLIGVKVIATDGPIGHVKSALFDDESWVIRYLVIDTGNWLEDREVLISPYSVADPLDLDDGIRVSLDRAQIEGSPSIDTHLPVSRQHERDYLDYYAFPEYWGGMGLWGMGAYPLAPPYRPSEEDLAAIKRAKAKDIVDVHLRSSAAVAGYEIEARDGPIGHVKDFVFEERTWAIRYVAVDTRNWWPGGEKVILATRWFDRFEWATRSAVVGLNRAQIKASPPFEGTTIDRGYERRLHEAYAMQDYWSARPVQDPADLLERT